MTDVRPFAALRFARDPGPRIAPPYDVLGDPERARLAEEPENIVHLTLPPGCEGERDYAAAATRLAAWTAVGVLVRDPRERLYALVEQTPAGRIRRGLFALVRLADYGERRVLPHERTMAGPKRDRLLLTRAVRANLEPLFFLYEDRAGKLEEVLREAAEGPGLARCTGPDGTGLALHALEAQEAIATVRAFLADRALVIADGHHRYETMLRYRDECEARGGAGPAAWVLGYLVNAFDPGTEIRPIHRLLRRAAPDPPGALEAAGFAVEGFSGSFRAEEILARLEARSRDAHAFAVVTPRQCWLATRARGRDLDVELLHAELLPRLGAEPSFDADAARVLATIAEGAAPLAVLQNPVSADALFRVVEQGTLLPQKSTFFSPKVPSGLVLRDLAGPAPG